MNENSSEFEYHSACKMKFISHLKWILRASGFFDCNKLPNNKDFLGMFKKHFLDMSSPIFNRHHKKFNRFIIICYFFSFLLYYNFSFFFQFVFVKFVFLCTCYQVRNYV